MNIKNPVKDYVFVTVQLLLFVAYGLPVKLSIIILPEWLHYSGLVISVISVIFGMVAMLQLNTKLSPFPSPVSSGRLLTTGAFRLSRHPIYTAIVFSGFGYAVFQTSLYKTVITLMLLILFYYKSVYEEKLLSHKFPEYHGYKKKTRRFI